MPAGFQPGKIYELIYQTVGSQIVGFGFAAVRDMVSFLKYDQTEKLNPCAGNIEYAYGFGRSQSGRFLRQMIYLGLNEAITIALGGAIIAIFVGGSWLISSKVRQLLRC
jgi:ABC-type dipeptide/oligopeptide/nickel transport system permease subunit